MNNKDLLDHCIELVKLYSKCSNLDEELVSLLQFTDSQKTKYQAEIFEVVLQQIVFLHDNVTTDEDWGQLTNRLFLSNFKLNLPQEVNQKLFTLMSTLKSAALVVQKQKPTE